MIKKQTWSAVYPVVTLGAKYLAIGHLLRRNILASKAPGRKTAYDLVCSHPVLRKKGRLVHVQVKCRLASDCDRGFPVEINTLESFDYLVLVFLNVPAVPYRNDNNYVKYSGRLADTLAKAGSNGAIWANQFDNVANRQGHVETTAQEIWRDLDGKVDAFICAVGTGGTLAGVSLGLKDHNPDIVIGLADPMGAALYSYYTTGELKAEGSSITEGIGQGRITSNLEGAKIDKAFQIPDAEALSIVFNLLSEEGLCLGGSSGINVAGAIRLAKEIGPGHTIVTVLCDYGTRYQSRLFNPTFLREKGLPVPGWLDQPQPAAPTVFV